MSTEKHPFMISLQQVLEEVRTLKRDLKLNNINNPEFVILDNADIMQMFKVSEKTVSNWRNAGTIKYYTVGGKIYYKLSEVLELFNSKKKVS